MTKISTGADPLPLPLAGEWAERRRRHMRSIALHAYAERLAGGADKLSAIFAEGWLPAPIASVVAASALERVDADRVFYNQVEFYYPAGTKIRMVFEGAPSPNAPYAFLVEHQLGAGERATHWYKFAPATDAEVEDHYKGMIADAPDLAAPRKVKPRLRPRTRPK